MSDPSAKDSPNQLPASFKQAAALMDKFQKAAVEASTALMHLTNSLYFVYGAALAGRGEPLRETLQDQGILVQGYFEEMLAIFHRHDVPILEEYTMLVPFIVDTVDAIEIALKEEDGGEALRQLLQEHGDLPTVLENVIPPVQQTLRPTKKHTPHKAGRPQNVVNDYLGRRALELRSEYPVTWANIFDILLIKLNEGHIGPLEEEAIAKMLHTKLKNNRWRAGDYLRMWAERYQARQPKDFDV